MDELVYVYIALDGAPQLCGRLWARARKGQESASFEYDEGWLRAANRFSLEPALSLGPGSFIPGKGRHCLERSATRLRIAGDAC